MAKVLNIAGPKAVKSSVDTSAVGNVAGRLSAIAAAVDQMNAGFTKDERAAVNAYARAVVMATVDVKDKDGDALGMPSLGKLGMTAFKLSLADRFGVANKDGDKKAVPLADVTLDMVISVTAADVLKSLDAAYDRGVEALEKSIAIASTIAELDKATGAYVGMKHDKVALDKLRLDGVAKLDGQRETAESWVRDVFPAIGYAVAVLNECNAGNLGGESAFAGMPVKLVVPIMLAGYSINANVIAKADLAARKGCKLLARIRKERMEDGMTPTVALRAIMGVPVEAELAAA